MDAAPQGRLARLIRDPFLHFLILGAALFLAFRFASGPGAAPEASSARIVVTQATADRIAGAFRATMQRPPTGDELRALIDGHVREEVLVREAFALGLDRDDAVIRQRLAQKMKFILDAGAEQLEPTDEQLSAFIAENAAHYRTPPRISFAQLFLGDDPTDAEFNAALAAVRAAPDAWREVGRATLLPPELDSEAPASVDGLFGRGFFDGAAKLKQGAWDGPVRSAYGLHFVRVTAFEPGGEAIPDTARDAALRDWRAARAKEMEEERYRQLLSRYEVVIEPAERTE